MAKSIIIIGGGIAGLAAGCYARMNGYDATIFEMHNLPGGLCTAWKRKGYTIDGCIHWLVGSKRKTGMYRIWDELGAVRGFEFHNPDEFFRIEHGGKVFKLYTDAARLEEHMLELAPEDRREIKSFIKAIRKLGGFDFGIEPAPEVKSLMKKILGFFKMMPYAPTFMKYMKLNTVEYSKRFNNEFLRQMIAECMDLPDFPVLGLIMTLGWMHGRNAGYPIGGSLPFARAIEKRYAGLGGEIKYDSKVERIIVEDCRTVGVRLADGSEHRADYVISAADGHATIFDMLEGKYVDDEIKGYFENMKPFPPLVYAAFGVKRDMSAEPGFVTWHLDEPVEIGGKEREKMNYRHFCHDGTLAPEGKSVVITIFDADYDRWKELAADREKYEAEKKKTSDAIIAEIDKRFPGFADDVEMVDVATPATFERYTGNWRGSFEGWLLTPKNMMLKMKKTLPGLSNFRMIGQWVHPGGGLPPAAIGARQALQVICKEDGIRFKTSLPQD